jgi:MBG domain (YGX type)
VGAFEVSLIATGIGPGNEPPAGFVNGDTAANLTAQPALSTTATTASPAGTYPISASGAASPNYTISYLPGTLTVTGVVAGGTISGIAYLDVTGDGLTADDTRFADVQVYLDTDKPGGGHVPSSPGHAYGLYPHRAGRE